ncbi:N-acetylmuramoyl-L-alanine amidase [Paenibacillus profundus]|uniref:N-acetylmuramoyl-L-alanine amidase n=1 Tax=Paenibacillus profundus TaxID=1173085 RepID=A0ABS8YDB9_9BACL|nr:N-acetylmuramoyl-L-alanine amidase [Paenibacillus profundus]MCE5168490.1 N-acetylmuramoyl-L-alanine amidase [Paenibacillus profundus]
MSIEIKQRLLPDGRPNKPNKPMVPGWITIHNTDNLTGTAESHARYILDGSGGRQASWHYTVDDVDIFQHLRDNEQGWHAGDGDGPGNQTSLGMEVCMFIGMKTEVAWRNAAWLAAFLINRHKLTAEHVVPHQKWSGKLCPSQLLPYWSKFINMVKEEHIRKQPCFAPIRDIGAAIGAPVVWDNGSKTASINGNNVAGGRLIGGKAYAPVRAVAEAAGAKVNWNGKEKTISIQLHL